MTTGPNESDRHQPAEVLKALREHSHGVLVSDGFAEGVKFVIDGRVCPSAPDHPGAERGRLVMPVLPTTLSASEFVLFVPEEREDHLQVLLEPRPVDPRGPDALVIDRHGAYHGPVTGVQASKFVWISAAIASARLAGAVYDRDELDLLNPLAPVESILLKLLNADRAALSEACQRHAGVNVADALAVGVDDLGVDVRARFGVVRLSFGQRAGDRAAAEQCLRSLLRTDH